MTVTEAERFSKVGVDAFHTSHWAVLPMQTDDKTRMHACTHARTHTHTCEVPPVQWCAAVTLLPAAAASRSSTRSDLPHLRRRRMLPDIHPVSVSATAACCRPAAQPNCWPHKPFSAPQWPSLCIPSHVVPQSTEHKHLPLSVVYYAIMQHKQWQEHIMRTSAEPRMHHKYEISHLKRLAIGEWPSSTLKVITIAAIR